MKIRSRAARTLTTLGAVGALAVVGAACETDGMDDPGTDGTGLDDGFDDGGLDDDGLG